MKNIKKYQWGKATLVGMASSLALIAAAPIAMAQEERESATAQGLTLPAGPLGDTLLAINEAFGVPVIASEDVVEGKTSPSISGARTADEALQQALEGTGLTANQSPNGAYVIALQTAATDTSPQQTAALAISYELERLLGHEKARKAQLSTDEMITIKKNLQTQKVDASDDLVRRHFVANENRLLHLLSICIRR